MKRIIILVLVAIMPGMKAMAQDWKSFLEDVAKAASDKASEKLSDKVDTIRLEGTWQYIQPDIQLETEDLLSKAASELAAKKVEEQLKNVLYKVGINEHTHFIFNADSTYTIRTDKRMLDGTYSMNKETNELTLTSQLQLQFSATVFQNVLKPSNMILRFKAEKLMNFLKQVSGTLAQKSANKNILMINELLNKYEGLTLGFELKK